MNTANTDHLTQSALIKMTGICKRFPGVVANDHIDLDIYPSEIHALLGENGAGKSTLMKILYGFYRSDEGEIIYQGNVVQIRSPFDARAINIGMVFQVLNLIPAMSVLENIALFLKDLPSIYNPSVIRDRIIKFSKQYGLEVNPDDQVSQLSIGEQQKVEILKLLLSDSRLLILDEPTRVLAPHEVDALFSVLDSLRKDGYAIILITHKLKEVLECADRITVLRQGKLSGSYLRSEVDEPKLIRLMFEKEIASPSTRTQGATKMEGASVVKLEMISTKGVGAATSLKNITLSIHGGEIVGVAGVSGNGQKELGDVVLGMEQISAGKKIMFEKDFSSRSISETRANGVGFIPENPLTMATVPFMTVLENMALTNVGRYCRAGGLVVDWNKVQIDLRSALAKFGFNFSPYTLAKSLSGGNLQRLIIAREMANDPKLIIASYPTSGLDVQSAMIARDALLQARNSGAAVLLISEDLDELSSLSDRLIVLYEGRIVGEFTPENMDLLEVGYLMTGSKANNGTHTG